MNETRPARLLLGPQRPHIDLGDVIERSGIAPDSLAVVSAGWQEAEADIDDVRAIIKRPLEDLELYRRADGLFNVLPKMHAAYRLRQDRLVEQQRLYTLRLRQLAIAARHTLRQSSDPEIARAEQRHAIRQLRALDRHHGRATEKLHVEFEARWQQDDVSQWRAQCEEIAAIIERHDAILITGGNVIVTINRLRLFGLGPLLERKPVVAWSAGAMALAPRIVLFHDHMPQGRREPELFGAGLGLLPPVTVLPDLKHRIDHGSRMRSGLMARRFAPHTCIALDNGSHVTFEGNSITSCDGAQRLTRGGGLKTVTMT